MPGRRRGLLKPPAVRSLTSDDRGELEQFSCRNFHEPWSDLVEELVQTLLADEIEAGRIRSSGLWPDGEALAAVIAWRPMDDAGDIHSIVLAVRNGHRRRGYGRILKAALVETARATGARSITSEVDYDNTPMIELNAAFNCTIVHSPDRRTCTCIIPIH